MRVLARLLERLRYRVQSRLTVISRGGTNRRVVYTTSSWIEAPNWTPDGKSLICNEAGRLCRIAIDHAVMVEPIAIEGVDGITNDHLLTPDGTTVYFTAQGAVFAAPMAGGIARKLSCEPIDPTSPKYYVHGLSPDGETLCCVCVRPEGAETSELCLLPTTGGAATSLLQANVHVDGPEYSPDGRWIWFNGEINAQRRGHSQIFRVRADGSGVEQMTRDDRVNWFPHPSPDGESLVYLSFASGTLGHPANQSAELHVVSLACWEDRVIFPISGGQGSINCNSWSPDGQSFAFVEYVRVLR
jgi:Tol biopolymer transport system component